MKKGVFGGLTLLDSFDPTSISKKIVDVPANRYSGFIVVCSGTNDTGDDYTFTDNANNARLTLNNQDIVNMDLGFLADLTNLEYGTPATPAASIHIS